MKHSSLYTRHIEIRAAEGGDDAKLLVPMQAQFYETYALSQGWSWRVLGIQPGWIIAEVQAKKECSFFHLDRENGGHRWQRVPPTERKGRVHTSTVTVVIRNPHVQTVSALLEKDVDMRFTKDTGPGGQHRNKTESCVVLTHRPTGISVKASDRCQHANRRVAWATLEDRVAKHAQAIADSALAHDRKTKAGSGMRGDKIRTYALQRHTATDHRSNIQKPWNVIKIGDLESFYS